MNFIANQLHLKFQRNRFSFFMKYFSGKSGKLLDLGGGMVHFYKDLEMSYIILIYMLLI